MIEIKKETLEKIIEWLSYLYRVSNTNKITDKKLVKFIEKLKELEDFKNEIK